MPQPSSHTNRLLGYPADARLLLINADDFGMCHAVNDAIIHGLTHGCVTSCSIMIPCPWSQHALTWLQGAPAVPVGVHLTAISEQPLYRWGPLLCRTEVPSLVDRSGFFYAESQIDSFVRQVDVTELEREFRAQIEHVLQAGVRLTHLDSHCALHIRHEAIFTMTLGLAREYGVALRVYDHPFINHMQRQGYPTNDHPLMDSYDIDTTNKAERYAHMLRTLPVGLSEWAIHPGVGNQELQAIMPDWWQVRQTDYDFVLSQAARQIVHEEGIILVDYTALQTLWNARSQA